MNSNDMLRFLQDLVDHPQELRKYKQNPAAYLEALALPPDIARLLFKLITQYREISTVFALGLSLQPDNSPKQIGADNEGIIFLEGQQVTFFAPCSPVIIESTINTGGDQCELSNDSYICIDPQNQVSFKLNISYTDPSPAYCYTFNISMNELPAPPSCLLENTEVVLNIILPLILTYHQPTIHTLFPGSYYNPSSQQLHLNFFHPSFLGIDA